MLLLYFLVKNYWLLFHWHHGNHPYSGRRAGERCACWDQRGQTKERGPHGSHKAALIQNLNQSQSGLEHEKPQNTAQNSQKSFYSIHKLLNVISLQQETWIQTLKSQQRWTRDTVLVARTWVDLRCDSSEQVKEDEQEEVSVPQVLHPRHMHRDRLPNWKTGQIQQVRHMCNKVENKVSDNNSGLSWCSGW